MAQKKKFKKKPTSFVRDRVPEKPKPKSFVRDRLGKRSKKEAKKAAAPVAEEVNPVARGAPPAKAKVKVDPQYLCDTLINLLNGKDSDDGNRIVELLEQLVQDRPGSKFVAMALQYYREGRPQAANAVQAEWNVWEQELKK